MLTAAAAGALSMPLHAAWAAQPAIEVWKDPSCGCCGEWVRHLEANGFRVKVNETGNAAARARLGIPASLGSCHTATVAGYTIEGHVPADAVRRLLAQRPAGVIGLAVPGMPLGSPGMESPTPQRYDVLAFDAKGGSRIYERR